MKASDSKPNSLNNLLNLSPCGSIQEVSCENVQTHFAQLQQRRVLFIDVRRPDEFNNELGHIPGAQLFTLGENLTEFLQTLPAEKEIIFICRSGARSAHATLESQIWNLHNTVNLQGGMLAWNQFNYEVEKT